MSLESNLELNNKLVAEQNTLLTQLLAAMAGGKPTFTPDTKPVPKAETVGADVSNTTFEPIDFETLDYQLVACLAVLFGSEAETLTEEQLTQAHALINSDEETIPAAKASALHEAMAEHVQRTKLFRKVYLSLCLQLLEHWDKLEGATARSEYVEMLVNTPSDKRAAVKPKVDKKTKKETTTPEPENDTEALFKKAEGLILQLAKGGYRSEAVAILDKFSAKKLGQVPADKLPEAIALAEKALEG
ncbi:hypothetical protein [Yersinia aleksiciae]|uniref:hypothetical protein n=1 Tax=Yersinia aleksiciae TaxID=263819 RepID=UPI001427D917|nr:hypothetical protein [Yersinia aleksiciae]MDA5497994.1 hypothetical protein [Yersinia aleksiciae]NIL01005.1 hypothetical protein [Yersinia aleksiciae]WQC71611.1 hypothetical protein N0K21_03860 [Yersinia aleksiciae]